jgi:hypothetical protein
VNADLKSKAYSPINLLEKLGLIREQWSPQPLRLIVFVIRGRVRH